MNDVSLRHDMTQPCRQCPFAGKVPGYIGPYDSPEELLEIAQSELPFPCHMTDGEGGLLSATDRTQACAGMAAFRNGLCKRVRDREGSEHQAKVAQAGVKVLSREEFLAIHG